MKTITALLFLAMLCGCGKPSLETQHRQGYQVYTDEFNGREYLIFTAHPNGGIFVMEKPSPKEPDKVNYESHVDTIYFTDSLGNPVDLLNADSVTIQIKGGSK